MLSALNLADLLGLLLQGGWRVGAGGASAALQIFITQRNEVHSGHAINFLDVRSYIHMK